MYSSEWIIISVRLNKEIAARVFTDYSVVPISSHLNDSGYSIQLVRRCPTNCTNHVYPY